MNNTSPKEIYDAICSQTVELIFTAHPTQVPRTAQSIQVTVSSGVMAVVSLTCATSEKQTLDPCPFSDALMSWRQE